MRRIFLPFLALIAGFILQACASNEVVVEAQAPATQQATGKAQVTKTPEATSEMPALPSPDVVIIPRQVQKAGVVTVSLDQIVAITAPTEPDQWRISYAESVLELLTPKANLENPGLKEWLFRAWAVGSTDIQLTSVPPACTDPLPCPQAPPQVITFTLEVK